MPSNDQFNATVIKNLAKFKNNALTATTLAADREQLTEYIDDLNSQINSFNQFLGKPIPALSNLSRSLHMLKTHTINSNHLQSHASCCLKIEEVMNEYKAGNIKHEGITNVEFISMWNELSMDEKLETLLEKADDELTAKAAKELRILLANLRNCNGDDPIKSATTVEILAKFILELIGKQHGIPCMSLAVDLFKSCKSFQDTIAIAYTKYQLAVMDDIQITKILDPEKSLNYDSEIKALESKVKEIA